MAREATTGEAEALRRIEAEHQTRTGWLDLGGLGLRRLPPALFDLTWLEGLNLGHRLRAPDGTETEWLDNGNQITTLPPALARLTALRRLFIDGNAVTDLGPVAGLSALQTLDCSYMRVATLGPVAGLSGLEALHCSGTGVADLGPVAGLSALQTLHCWRTKVADLGPVAGLSALQALHCSGTRVADLGPVAGLSALQALHCSGTGVADLGPVAGLSALQQLNCSETRVADLGPVAGLSALQTLDCLRTRVADLGPVAGLSALQELDCSGTGVADLGPVAGLSALQALVCSGTGVTDLGPVAGLSALQTLDCSGTGVADLGPVAGLSALQTLFCSRTGVADLGPVAGLSALQTLFCSGTWVADLGPVAGLSRLQMLVCSGTPVADLPRRLVEQVALTGLHLHNTRIRTLPPEVLSQYPFDNCLPRVRAHLIDLDAGAVPLRTTKVIVLGNGRVGKTQLCRRLRGLDYDDTVKSTHGITIATTAFGDGETLNLWDFGGQDIYHGAHALFMRTRAVFVVAWHPDYEATPNHTHEGMAFENRPLAYWLAFVQAMGAAGSPVIVVQCQVEDRKQVVRAPPVDAALIEALDAEVINYSARTDRGRGALDDAIGDAIKRLRERDGLASIGAGRARVVERLMAWRAEDEPRPADQRQHRVIGVHAFAALCAEVGGVSSPEALLHYLHHSGLVYHDPHYFAGRVLLDITWALDAIYSVFDRHTAWRHLQATHGRFKRAQLAATVWQAHGDDEQRLFLRLMRSCGICFRHGERHRRQDTDDAEYIAPDLLPDEAAVDEHLAGRWDEDAPANTLTHDYDFLHPGLFRGLMARIGEAADGTGVYWRTGLWLYAPETRTRLRIDCTRAASGHGGRLTVQMQGDDPKLADWLREQIADQHRRYGQAGLSPTIDTLPKPTHAESRPLIEAPTDDCADAAPAAAPQFGAMPPEEITRPEPDRPKVYISYARSDGTPQAEESARVADALVDAIRARDLDPHIDYTDTAVGDSISAFMDRLIDGDFIFVILGEKYLRSEYCMYELYHIWQRTQRDPERFRGRVIPILLDGTAIGTLEDRIAHAAHWKMRHETCQRLIQADSTLIAPEDFARSKHVAEYYLHVASILYLLNDRLIPRDLTRLEATAYAEVIALIRPPT